MKRLFMIFIFFIPFFAPAQSVFPNFGSQDFLMWIVYVGIGIGISYLLVRWFWDIGERNRQLRAQTRYLSEIARKLGVDNETIEGIGILAFPPDRKNS